MKKLVGAVALAIALIASACNSTNHGVDDASEIVVTPGPSTDVLASALPSASAAPRARATTGTGSGPAAATDAPEVSIAPDAIRSPIKIGFVGTAVSNAGDAGVSLADVQTISDGQAYNALIDYYNAHGGIAGRKIQPIFAQTDTGSNSWEGDFAAACAKFTQDNHVAAVIGYVFAYYDSFETCLQKAGVPHISTAYSVPAEATMKRYSTLFNLDNPSHEHREIARIDGAIADGVLKKGEKLGVVADGCSEMQRAWKETISPHLKAKGFTPAVYAPLKCSNGSDDNAATVNDLGNAILKMRTEGVQTVLELAEGPGFLLFATAAEGQVWRPKYIVTSLSAPAALAQYISKNQLRNVYGYGWLPAQDVAKPQRPEPSAAAKRCLDIYASKGLQPSTALDYWGLWNTCDAFFAFEKTLQITRGKTGLADVKSAIESFGSRFISAATVGGKTNFTSTRHDGPSAVRAFAWDASCECFTYRGPLRPM